MFISFFFLPLHHLQESKVNFHVVALKCQHCGGYNTTRIGGDDPLPEDPSNTLRELVHELNVAEGDGNASGDEGVEEGWETTSEVEDDDDNVEAILDEIITEATEEESNSNDDDDDNKTASGEESENQIINNDVNIARREGDT